MNYIAESKMWDPIFMRGSTFGKYFQAYYKIGKFEELMKMTSKESIEKYGYDKILKAYEKMDFGYSLKFKSMNTEGKDMWIMSYETEQYTTKKMLRMKVKLENDTIKLVLTRFKRNILGNLI